MPASQVDKDLLAALDRAFAKHAGADHTIHLEDLQKALGLRSEYMARRMMILFDRNGDGVINKGEFLEGVRTLVFGNDREKLYFAFRLHDHDGDGTLDEDELLRMITMSLYESDIAEKPSQTPEFLARVLMQAADKNRDGRVTFEEFEQVVREHPALLHTMTHNEAIWIAPNEDLLLMADERARGKRLRPGTARERESSLYVTLGLVALANVAIFVGSLVINGAFVTSNPLMELGRATGRCLDFCGALVLLPMMRRLLTWIRRTWLGDVVPVDDSIDFHKVVGHTLFFLSLSHAAFFIGAFTVGHPPGSIVWLLETLEGLTGFILLGVFTVMWLFSLSFIRRSSRFELFATTHLLWIAWFTLAIVHGPPFVLWAGVPLLGFGLEHVLRLRRRKPPCVVAGCRPLRSGVTRVDLQRPPGFDFSPGDYVFLRIPAIARREWHPFTISSAPEREGLTFHVRSLGNWTAALRRYAERNPDTRELLAYIDGPYGSPSAHIFASRHAVLIGAGIGVTPFASVLESIVLRAYGYGNRPSNLQRVDFFWLNKDQVSFEWFSALLAELEKIDTSGMLHVNLCMTRARAGASNMGLEIAREIMHAAGRSDIVTGLRTHTHTGTPDWPLMLGGIRARHSREKIDVFFCGPPGLARRLRPICAGLDMPFHEEKF